MSHPSTSYRERSFPCDRCGDILSYDSDLYIHQRHDCPREKSYPCGLCSGSFRTQRSLQQHVDACHDTYVCDRCPFRCHDRPTFLDHMQRHRRVDRNRRTFQNEYPGRSHPARRRSQRIRKNVRCFLCNRMPAEGIAGRTRSHSEMAPVAEVRIKLEPNSTAELNIEISAEPNAEFGRMRTAGNASRAAEDLEYWERIMKTLLLNEPGLLRMWYERTFDTPFPSRTDSQ